MNKTISLIVTALLASSIVTTVAVADAKKGQQYYAKQLKTCVKDGIQNGGVFAGKHDRDEWLEIKEKGTVLTEWKELCPSGTKIFDKMKKKQIQDLYDFCWQYAADGDVPSCQ